MKSLFFLMFISLLREKDGEREREREKREFAPLRGAEREGDTESEAGSRL